MAGSKRDVRIRDVFIEEMIVTGRNVRIYSDSKHVYPYGCWIELKDASTPGFYATQPEHCPGQLSKATFLRRDRPPLREPTAAEVKALMNSEDCDSCDPYFTALLAHYRPCKPQRPVPEYGETLDFESPDDFIKGRDAATKMRSQWQAECVNDGKKSSCWNLYDDGAFDDDTGHECSIRVLADDPQKPGVATHRRITEDGCRMLASGLERECLQTLGCRVQTRWVKSPREDLDDADWQDL